MFLGTGEAAGLAKDGRLAAVPAPAEFLGLPPLFLGIAPVVFPALRALVLYPVVLTVDLLGLSVASAISSGVLVGLTCRSGFGFAVLAVSFFGRLSVVLPSFFLLAVFFGLSDGWSGLSFLATLALGLLLVVRAKLVSNVRSLTIPAWAVAWRENPRSPRLLHS